MSEEVPTKHFSSFGELTNRLNILLVLDPFGECGPPLLILFRPMAQTWDQLEARPIDKQSRLHKSGDTSDDFEIWECDGTRPSDLSTLQSLLTELGLVLISWNPF